LSTQTHGQTENAAKIKDEIPEDKNGQLVTGGIFYCRDSAEINGCGSLQTSSWLDSDVLRNRQQKHTAKPLATIVKRHQKHYLNLKNDKADLQIFEPQISEFIS
jgi:hypothetical protein